MFPYLQWTGYQERGATQRPPMPTTIDDGGRRTTKNFHVIGEDDARQRTASTSATTWTTVEEDELLQRHRMVSLTCGCGPAAQGRPRHPCNAGYGAHVALTGSASPSLLAQPALRARVSPRGLRPGNGLHAPAGRSSNAAKACWSARNCCCSQHRARDRLMALAARGRLLLGDADRCRSRITFVARRR